MGRVFCIEDTCQPFSAKANDSPTVPTDKVKAIIKAQGEILVPAQQRQVRRD